TRYSSDLFYIVIINHRHSTFSPSTPLFRSSLGHAHEMLFGFALAVVAGYVLGPQPKTTTLSLVALWSLARLTFLMWPTHWLRVRSEEHTSELQSSEKLVCRLLLEKKKRAHV